MMQFLSTNAAREAVVQLAGRSLSPSDQIRLRKEWGIDKAKAIASQNVLYRKIQEKFAGELLLATDRSLQQATDALVANYKASRFPTGVTVIDGCCGIGGDLRFLALRGPVIGVDRDEELCIAAAANVPSATIICGSIENYPFEPDSYLHIDPDRRPNSSRVSRVEFSSPGVEVLDRLLGQVAGTAIKLSPAAEIPDHWRPETERTWISSGGECRQQVVWFGVNSLPNVHRAVALLPPAEPTHGQLPRVAEFIGQHNLYPDEASTVGRFIYDLDPSIRASGLAGAFAISQRMKTLGGVVGYLTSDQASLVFDKENTRFLATPFEVIETLPFDKKRLRAAVQAMNVDIHEIKVRGVEQSPEQIRRITRVSGGDPATLLVGRGESGVFAAIARRLDSIRPVK